MQKAVFQSYQEKYLSAKELAIWLAADAFNPAWLKQYIWNISGTHNQSQLRVVCPVNSNDWAEVKWVVQYGKG